MIFKFYRGCEVVVVTSAILLIRSSCELALGTVSVAEAVSAHGEH